jgi:hypothetical protein
MSSQRFDLNSRWTLHSHTKLVLRPYDNKTGRVCVFGRCTKSTARPLRMPCTDLTALNSKFKNGKVERPNAPPHAQSAFPPSVTHLLAQQNRGGGSHWLRQGLGDRRRRRAAAGGEPLLEGARAVVAHGALFHRHGPLLRYPPPLGVSADAAAINSKCLTELCHAAERGSCLFHPWSELKNNHCVILSRCSFAHHPSELRQKQSPWNARTKPCSAYHGTGYCPCTFHPPPPSRARRRALPIPPLEAGRHRARAVSQISRQPVKPPLSGPPQAEFYF